MMVKQPKSSFDLLFLRALFPSCFSSHGRNGQKISTKKLKHLFCDFVER